MIYYILYLHRGRKSIFQIVESCVELKIWSTLGPLFYAFLTERLFLPVLYLHEGTSQAPLVLTRINWTHAISIYFCRSVSRRRGISTLTEDSLLDLEDE